ncbi:MAG: outer membrane lipoprotein carrier protein LolA [Desulfobacterales bacterium]|nr:outer membrane lipoprotein carrier protein LolA [Desulfobacterales bacterium]
MKKTGIANLFATAVMLAAASLGAGWADTWDDIKAGAGKVTSISAEFTQEKHLKILVRPLISKGVLYFQAPHSLRWEYRSPIQSILLSHNGKTKRYIRNAGKVTEDAGTSLPALQVVLHEITRWLNGRFDENPAFIPHVETGRKIVLTPKEQNYARMIQRIELFLSDRPGIVKSVVIYEDENSFTKIEFENVVLNPPLLDTLFQEIE